MFYSHSIETRGWHAALGRAGSADDNEVLSDDDCVACIFESGKRSEAIVEIGIAEGFVVVDGKKVELRHEVRSFFFSLVSARNGYL